MSAYYSECSAYMARKPATHRAHMSVSSYYKNDGNTLSVLGDVLHPVAVTSPPMKVLLVPKQVLMGSTS
jgi:hypothetical protein